MRVSWARQVLATPVGGTTAPVLSLAGIQRALVAPPDPVRQIMSSLHVLESTLRASPSDYRPPATGFGGVQMVGTDETDPLPTLDVCVHLFANRIGVTMTREIVLRHAVAATIAREGGDLT